jgi:acyl-coenzyme A synthetase/AMP-(fatty) acid ligase
MRSLPSYMLPSRWLAFDALPKNANGKIDRPALRESFDREGTSAAGG